MNLQNLKELKQYYETQLIDTLSSVLKADRANFAAEWSINRAVVYFTMVDGNMISNYQFIYTDTLIISAQTHEMIMNGTKQVHGIISTPTIIDMPTMNIINNIFETILNSEMPTNDDAAQEAEEAHD